MKPWGQSPGRKAKGSRKQAEVKRGAVRTRNSKSADKIGVLGEPGRFSIGGSGLRVGVRHFQA